jgi:phosphatidyl-myo-inositol dimannoside synthase
LSAARHLSVLVVTPDFPPAPGGIQLLMHRLVRHWTIAEPHVLTLAAIGGRSFDEQAALTIRRTRNGSVLGHRASLGWLNLRAVLSARRRRPDAVLSGHIVTSPAAWAIRRITGAPFVQYLYAEEVIDRPRLARFAIAHAAAVIVLSRHAEILARSLGARSDRLHRIPTGVDLPGFRLAERSLRPTVVTVARLGDRYKGHDVMLRALELIRLVVPDVLWVVIGDGPLRAEYEARALSSGLRDHVLFTGRIDDRERDRWLDRAHVFAMPSRLSPGGGGEGFGIVFLEAGAHGLPAVAGNVGGALDVVVDGETGVLVDPTDPRAVAAAISALLRNPERAEALGRAGAARAAQLQWPAISQRVEAIVCAVASA